MFVVDKCLLMLGVFVAHRRFDFQCSTSRGKTLFWDEDNTYVALSNCSVISKIRLLIFCCQRY